MKKLFAILLLAVFAGNTTQAQALTEAEKKIQEYLEGINYWRFKYSAEDTSFAGPVNKDDSLMAVNNRLFDYLIAAGAKQPALLRKQPALPENSDMTVVTSDDKKLSIYSWDTHMGGALHIFNVVGMYQAGAVRTAAINRMQLGQIVQDMGGAYENIITVNGNGGKKYYLAVSKIKVSEKEHSKTITAYTIEGTELKRADIFFKNNAPASSITYQYDYIGNYDFKKMQETQNVYLGKSGRKLYVPAMGNNNQLTGEWQVYNFDGSKFEYEKTEK